jgi:TctA family transporter
MLIPPPKGKLDLTFSFVWVIILSNIITVAVCFLFLKPLAKVTQVRGGIIIPLILVLIYLGAYAEKNAFPDMVVVLLFGGLGWVMEKMEWPRPPVLLGLVLGPLAENRLFLSTDNYGLNWTSRPGVIIIFAITLFGIFYPIVKSRRQRPVSNTTDSARAVTPRRGGIHFGPAALFTLLIAAMIAVALFESRNFGFRAGLFPWVIGIPTLLFALVQLAKDVTGQKEARAADEEAIAPELARERTVSIIGWTVGCFLAIWLLGFSYAVPLFIFIYLKLEGREGWLMSIAVTFFSWLFFYMLFERMLNVPFPDPLLLSIFS